MTGAESKSGEIPNLCFFNIETYVAVAVGGGDSSGSIGVEAGVAGAFNRGIEPLRAGSGPKLDSSNLLLAILEDPSIRSANKKRSMLVHPSTSRAIHAEYKDWVDGIIRDYGKAYKSKAYNTKDKSKRIDFWSKVTIFESVSFFKRKNSRFGTLRLFPFVCTIFVKIA